MWDLCKGWSPCQCADCELKPPVIPTPLHPSAIGREYDLFRIELNNQWGAHIV
jgi:hypothetical protein